MESRFEANYAVGHAGDGKVYPKDKLQRRPRTLHARDHYRRLREVAVLRRERRRRQALGTRCSNRSPHSCRPPKWAGERRTQPRRMMQLN